MEGKSSLKFVDSSEKSLSFIHEDAQGTKRTLRVELRYYKAFQNSDDHGGANDDRGCNEGAYEFKPDFDALESLMYLENSTRTVNIQKGRNVDQYEFMYFNNDTLNA